MEIVYQQEELLHYMKNAVKVNADHPVLIDRYMTGKEIEVDAISDGENVLIPGIMEHIERAGVHSGDSIAVYPPQSLSEKLKEQIIEHTIGLGKGLNIVGLLNIQFVVFKDEVYVIEVNPRASRTVPFLSKITGRTDGKYRNKSYFRSKPCRTRIWNRLSPRREGSLCKSTGILICKTTLS